MVKTLDPEKTKIAKQRSQLPTFPGLVIDIDSDCKLDDATQKLVDDYHGSCRNFEDRTSTLHGSRSRLLDAAIDQTLRSTLDDAQKLNSDRAALERELVALRWRRFEVLPQLVPSFQRFFDDSVARYDKAISEARQVFASKGVTVDSMPAGQKNVRAAEQQLEFKLRQELGPLAAKSVVTRSKSALDSLNAQRGNPPSFDACRIDWQGAPAGILSDVARIARLDSGTPTVQPALEMSDRAARRILRETGLIDSPLTPQHVDLINALDKVIPEDVDHYRPLGACPAKQLPKVRELLAKLPPTSEIKHFIAATKDGPVVYLL